VSDSFSRVGRRASRTCAELRVDSYCTAFRRAARDVRRAPRRASNSGCPGLGVLATMGAAGSKTQRLEKALGTTFPESEHFYGLENFGNTCYANSVLQALYYCLPMREHCIAYAAQCEAAGTTEDDLLSSLCDLFVSISNQRRRCGVHAPRRFIAKLRNENELFNNQMHQVRRGSRHRARAATACLHSHGPCTRTRPATHTRTHAWCAACRTLTSSSTTC